MKNLITGANGFLGSNLIKALLNENEEIIAMVRPTSNLRRLEEYKDRIEFRYCQLHDYDMLIETLQGIDRVIHLAANVRIGSFKKKEIYRDNVIGSQNIFNAAKTLKIKEILYVSSISIFGSSIEDIVNEEDIAKGKIMSTYGETKLESYYAFKNAYNNGLNIKAVIPANIYGPDDPNFGPLFKNYVQKHLKIIAGNLNANMGMVYIDDVCSGILLAAKKGKSGEAYILNAENITLNNLLKKAEQITGIKPPSRKIPKPIIKSAALLSDLTGRIVRNNMLLNRQSAKLLYTTHPMFDSSKARKKLGWIPQDFNKTFEYTLQWYLDKYKKNKKLKYFRKEQEK
jgi:dihydroflavonol-4-reductase